jgi:hypothetical protein
MESRFEDEFGASTGDKRENDPSLPGFTEEDDRLFRSHFQHANRFADRSYEDARPAYAFGYAASADPRHAGKGFDEVEKDLESGWMNERFSGDEWQTVRDYAREGFERGRRTGFMTGTAALGGSPSHQRPSFSDPIAGGIDPTAPDSPEQQEGAGPRFNEPTP